MSITHISPASNSHFASFCNLPLDDVTCGLAVQADYHCEPFYLWTVTQNEQIYWTTLRTVCATPHCCKPSADCTFSQSVRLWVSQESHGIKLSLSKSCQKHNLWITPQWCWIVDNISGYYSRLLWRILWDCHCVKFSIWFEVDFAFNKRADRTASFRNRQHYNRSHQEFCCMRQNRHNWESCRVQSATCKQKHTLHVKLKLIPHSALLDIKSKHLYLHKR